MIELSEQEIVRRDALDKIRAMGVNPYPAEGFEVNATTLQIAGEFSPEKNNFQNVGMIYPFYCPVFTLLSSFVTFLLTISK
jgi:hypothetical protein